MKETKDSYPYITGNGYRNRSHYVYDFHRHDSPNVIKKDGEICFVKTDLLQQFFNIDLPKIKYRIILVTHNSAYGIDDRFFLYLENKKIIHWFAQNANILHPKLTSIPLGISNSMWEIGDIDALKYVMDMEAKKEKLLYLNFNCETNPQERKPVYNKFIDKSYVYFSGRKSFKDYLVDIASSKYIISPPGRGMDCVRIWESLYLKSIPIVMECNNINFYRDLPIMIIKSWDEVNEEILEEKYKDFEFKNMEKLYMDYWIKKIGLKDIFYQLEDKYE